MRRDLFENIKTIIEKSSLPEKDKLDIISVFSKFPEADAEVLLELMNEDEKIIQLLNNNFKLKQGMSLDNKELWQKILKNEEEVLSSIEK